MSDRTTRRLYSALPRDIERLWIISQSARELKDNIIALRKKVQKFRDEALSAWEESQSQKKTVHYDKWGVPCATASKETDIQEDKEDDLVEPSNKTWEIPLDERNSDVQVVMKVSPRKAVIQQHSKNESETNCTEKNNSTEKDQIEPSDNLEENIMHETDAPNNPSADLNAVDIESSTDVVKKASRKESTTTTSRDDSDIIRVHVEASGKTRNQVKISFGSDCNPDMNKAKNAAETFTEINGHKVPRKEEDATKTKRVESKQKRRKVKSSTKTSKTKEHVKKLSRSGSKTSSTKTSSQTLENLPAKKKEAQKIEYKALPSKEDKEPDLNPGKACYPSDKISSKNEKGVLSKKRSTPKKRSHCDDFNADTHDRKKTNTAGQKNSEYFTVLDVNYKNTDAGPRLECDSKGFKMHEANIMDNNERTFTVLSQAKRDGDVLENSIDIVIPKPSTQRQSELPPSAQPKPQVLKPQQKRDHPQKPFLKRILDIDSANPGNVTDDYAVESDEDSAKNVANPSSSFTESVQFQRQSPKEEKIELTYETFQAIKNIIGQIDTATSENKKFKETLEVVVAHSIEAPGGSDNQSEETEHFLGLPVDTSTLQGHNRVPKHRTLEPSDESHNESFLGASLWDSSKLEDISQSITRKAIEDKICDASGGRGSFLGAPLLSSTHHGDTAVAADAMKEKDEDDDMRRAIWSTSSGTDSVTSSQLGLDYSGRFRVPDEGIDGQKLNGCSNDLRVKGPCLVTSDDGQQSPESVVSRNQDLGLHYNDASGKYGIVREGPSTEEFSLDGRNQENPILQENDSSRNAQSQWKDDTGYNTLKLTSTADGKSAGGLAPRNAQLTVKEDSMVFRKEQSSDGQRATGRERWERNSDENPSGRKMYRKNKRIEEKPNCSDDSYESCRRSFSISSRSESDGERASKGGSAELRIRQVTGIRDDRHNSHHYHDYGKSAAVRNRNRSWHNHSARRDDKSLASRDERRARERKGEHRVQETIRNYHERRPHHSHQEYRSTTEYDNDGNGSGSIHIDARMICQCQSNENRRH